MTTSKRISLRNCTLVEPASVNKQHTAVIIPGSCDRALGHIPIMHLHRCMTHDTCPVAAFAIGLHLGECACQ